MSMGVWEAMASTADGVRRRLPDPAPLKNACSSAYGLGAATFNTVRAASPDLSAASAICRRSASWIDRTVRVDAPRRISAAVSGPDGRNRIARTTWNLLDHALEHGTRPYTGGIPAYRILKEGLFSSELPIATTVGKEMSYMRKRLEKLEALEAARGAEGAAAEGIMGSGALQYDRRMRGTIDPGDVIESFMMSGFRGGDFINEQVIPVVDESRRRARRDFLLYIQGQLQPFFSQTAAAQQNSQIELTTSRTAASDSSFLCNSFTSASLNSCSCPKQTLSLITIYLL